MWLESNRVWEGGGNNRAVLNKIEGWGWFYFILFGGSDLSYSLDNAGI